MPRKSTSSSQSPTTTSLALSSIHIRLETLDKEHQWLLKQIKRKRTELKNFVEQMRSLAADIFNRCNPKFQKLVDIDREIHTLFDEILTLRKLGKQSRKDIEAIYYQLQIARVISPNPKNHPEDEDTELDELFETNEQDDHVSGTHTEENHQYQEASPDIDFSSGNKSDAARKIRQTFLSLAEIFHPDKVKDGETQMRHTEIMKEINKAYQEGDLARLLEIEQQHQVGKSIDSNSEDDLTRQCARIEQQNEILTNQYEKLKQELRLVKNTPEGAIVSDCRKASKEGIDPIGSMAEQVEAEIKTIAAIRDFVRDFREQKITIKEFVCGPVNLRQMNQDAVDDMFEQMFVELGEVMFF
ncbi:MULTISPECIES: J domain-containing protein [unclassified Nodularia (in: cyanobacteria)]|uniref:J domain-containing protein n=1 Tax=unclassified Nodularia (in: cyanobacteria) TaxID=2656917 RepID=UPI001881A30E|nr:MULTISPECIES: J domain-containing protein [unclassified Nodularia (in: cyanobacteria)]MBE9199864.1 J domain-containing protein [Nodularia sp. LEGE 06071]MCC2692257.1 J domain-containing protein [Nodularia sp. LEGE 04288]